MKKLLSFIQGIPTQYENGVKRLAARAASANGHQPETIHYDQIEHGLFVLSTTLLNSLLLVAAIFILHLEVPLILWFTIIYSSLRLVSFGIHFQHTWTCLTVSMLYYLGSYYIAQTGIPVVISLPGLLICLLIYYKFAPGVEAERPPLSKAAHKTARRRIFILLALYTILAFALSHPYNQLTLAGIFCQAINLLPIWKRAKRR